MSELPLSPEALCVEKLKLLADTTRLGVLSLLLDGPKYVVELNATLGMEQSLLSHHLQALRRAGLVECSRDGKAMLYRLAAEVETGFDCTRSGQSLNLGCCTLSFPSPILQHRKSS